MPAGFELGAATLRMHAPWEESRLGVDWSSWVATAWLYCHQGPVAEGCMAMRLRLTTRDLELLPDIEGVRYELIDGELHVTRQPSWPHQYASSAVSSGLFGWSVQTGEGQT